MNVPEFSHLDDAGEISMVDIAAKPISERVAVATGRIRLTPDTMRCIAENAIAKGNVLATARLAGIQAAKRTADLIPLCHNILIEHVGVDFHFDADGIAIRASVRTVGRTGAEMEALTAVSVAALTIYDMCKAVDKTMVIEAVTLESKTKRAIDS